MGLRIFESLAFKLAAMLSVALLPLGLIALIQTAQVMRQAEQLTVSAVVGRNSVAIEPQRDLMYVGFAGARVLSNAVVPFLNLTDECNELMRDFVRSNPDYSLAMFLPSSGVTSCNSRGEQRDLRSSRIFTAFQEDQRPRVVGLETAPITGGSELVIAQPVFASGNFAGVIWLSLPRENISLPDTLDKSERPESMVTFNREGEVLLASGSLARDELPDNQSLADLTKPRATSFLGRNRVGKDRIFTVTPIIRGVVYSISTWEAPDNFGKAMLPGRLALLFPIVMWLTSLCVAYVAVHRLVVRHIRALRGKMRRFAGGSRSFDPGAVRGAPAELRQMEETFIEMAQTISRDEADLENGLREKNVLLKEVHHRVKNNLQLIASIMNMEIRKAANVESRSALRRVQDRVLGIATVHGNLYHTTSLASVRAASLLSDILNQTLVSALPPDGSIEAEIDIDDVTLFPDQAVPLALLTTEAAANAVKYIGRPDNGSPARVRVALEQLAEDRVRLVVENTVGTPLNEIDGDQASTGLGTQLIKAFAMQLGSRVNVEEGDGHYRLSLEVTVAPFTPGDEEA